LLKQDRKRARTLLFSLEAVKGQKCGGSKSSVLTFPLYSNACPGSVAPTASRAGPFGVVVRLALAVPRLSDEISGEDAANQLGGISAIVIDNQLSNGGTNLYFSTIAPGSLNGQMCNVSGGTANPYCAVKLTQSALQ
jgi:hypothetical protein